MCVDDSSCINFKSTVVLFVLMPPVRSIRVRGFSFRYNDPHDVLGIIESVVFDVYQSRHIREGDLVVDIGAGVGDFTIVASKRVGHTGHVIAIEPSPDDFESLSENLVINRCDNVSALNSAVSGTGQGTVELRFKGRSFHAQSKRLREILSDSGASKFGKVTLLKMDVEGAEVDIVPDNIELMRNCEWIAMEFHNGSQRLIAPRIEEMGFRFRRVQRTDYLVRLVALCLSHPIQSYRLYKAVKESPAFHGVAKLTSGLDISNSDELIVGVFTRVRP